MEGKDTLIVGTRGSLLALWQARHVAARLEEALPGVAARLEVIRTRGDAVLDAPLSRIGGKGLFTREIEEALLDGRIDLAVHSIKDLPTEVPEGLEVGAIPVREEPWDALVSRDGRSLDALPPGARVGTSSLRRRALILAVRPDLRVVELRGNVDTRLGKVAAGEVDAAVLALAGLRRLGREGEVSQVLDGEAMVPAVGQGALGIEVRSGDPRVAAAVAALHDAATARAVTAERAVLAALDGGCQVPLGAHARDAGGGRIELRAFVALPDGSEAIRVRAEGAPGEAASAVIARLRAAGAEELLARARAAAPGPIPPTAEGGAGG
ncbi:hydroxymethylbilane synthase [Myxococcota bacterium]|nr:hydroxymethylbilane synthase [Myxococcota bacterium]